MNTALQVEIVLLPVSAGNFVPVILAVKKICLNILVNTIHFTKLTTKGVPLNYFQKFLIHRRF